MNIATAFPARFLRACDLDGDTTLEMSRVEEEEVGQEAVPKPVLYFVGIEKGLVLNKTNAGIIASDLGYGTDTDDWCGRPITLFPTQTEFRASRLNASA